MSISITKVSDKVAAEKSNTCLEDSTAATQNHSVHKKELYDTRDEHSNVEYKHYYEDGASSYGHKVQDYKAQH